MGVKVNVLRDFNTEKLIDDNDIYIKYCIIKSQLSTILLNPVVVWNTDQVGY